MTVEAETVEQAVSAKPIEECIKLIQKMLADEIKVGGILCFTSGKKECEEIASTVLNKTKELKEKKLLCFDIFKDNTCKTV